uniref:Heterokaryon incompatibility domain-containing protein n=1 Tax=Bionectria ochroleuca TaxID=29856 RepID=A0A8H7TLR7_BIOOC
MLSVPNERFTTTNSSKHSLFIQLRTWLQKCDKDHNCMRRRNNKDLRLPTRILDIKPSDDPTSIRLHVVEEADQKKADKYRYLALSHRWGDKEPPWRTLQENILQRRMKGFKLDELPKTFQDAIEVTRELGIKYLWIDSLCIIQDNSDDWKQESERMHSVYASAYCTIAATSGLDSSAGFLAGIVPHENLLLQDEQGQPIVISTNVADFEKDVNQGGLSKRAWVMQERYLSPRTIHFTHSQIYAECGEGVCVGDNIFLQCNEETNKFFRLDPQFPNRLKVSGFAATLKFLLSMLEGYSQCDITKSSDRAIAISGLLTRIEQALPCSIYHGIFAWYLHRTLLWNRSNGQTTEKIRYELQSVPSWSWLAYPGPIEFCTSHLDYRSLDVLKNLRSTGGFEDHDLGDNEPWYKHF